MENNIYLLFVILILTGTVNGDIYTPPFVLNSQSTNLNQVMSPTTGPSVTFSSSSTPTPLPVEGTPINITRKIIQPKRDGGFFIDDVIVVLVKVTSMRKENLENLEIWEIPDGGLKIENCSYPIRTSSVREMLDYESSDKSYLKENDIVNITSVRDLLLSKKEPYAYIYKLLSSNTKQILNDSNSQNFAVLKEDIINDFNKLIDNTSVKDINSSLLIKNNISLNPKKVYSYNPNLNEYNNTQCDHRLIKRRLLETLFPYGLKSLPFYKEHEDFEFDNCNNSINVNMQDLYQGESIVFKYYLHPESYGKKEIRSIIRTKDFLHEEVTSLNIIEREPQFQVQDWVGSKELILNKSTKFEYYVKYLGGDEPNKSFTANIIAPPFCNIKDASDRIKNFNLSIGRITNFTVNATYNKTGSTYSPPIISIGRFKAPFPEDIEVYTEEQKDAKIGFEKLTIDISKYNLYSVIILALINIFILVHDYRWNKGRIQQILEANNGLIKAQNETMRTLVESLYPFIVSNNQHKQQRVESHITVLEKPPESSNTAMGTKENNQNSLTLEDKRPLFEEVKKDMKDEISKK